MKLLIRDKDKDKQASTSVKSRMIVIKDRIWHVLKEIEALQKKYDLVNLEIEESKHFISKITSAEELENMINSKLNPMSDSIQSLKYNLDQFLDNNKYNENHSNMIVVKGGKPGRDILGQEENKEVLAVEIKGKIETTIKSITY